DKALTVCFFSVVPQKPGATLFPYTTLFRSAVRQGYAAGIEGAATADGQRAGVGEGGGRGDSEVGAGEVDGAGVGMGSGSAIDSQDRKSTRLNSSHVGISYAVYGVKREVAEG